jgi:predicted amidohydrolase YtcJ
MEYFPGGTPRKEDLDAIVPDRPVFLFNRDVHGAWVNSAALRVAGIDASTPDPPDGRIERDGLTGEPTGTLHEGAAYAVNERFVPLPDQAEWERAILVAQRHLHALGITAWQDAWVTPETQGAYSSLDAQGLLTARVVGALWWDRHTGLAQVDELIARRAEGGSRRFAPTSVKIMVDGVLENYTGALLEPYCDGCGHGGGEPARGHSGSNRGLSYVDPDALKAAVGALDRHGFQVHLHTIGDRAVRQALDAVEYAIEVNGHLGNRHQLAHVQIVDPADIARFAALGVVANIQAYWAQWEPQLSELTEPFLGPDRMARMYPFGELLAAGARLAMGSDWSVTTANPLDQIEVAVTRRPLGEPDAQPLLAHQALTVDEAVSAFTAGSAYANGLEKVTGVVAPGYAADLTVIDRDIFAGPESQIATGRVALTMVDGEVVHST